MGKKTTTYGPSPSSPSKKAKKVVSTSTTNTPPSRAQVAQGNHPTPSHVINKYELQFDDQEHINCYNLVSSRNISEPKYIDDTCLDSIGLLNDINEMVEVVAGGCI